MPDGKLKTYPDEHWNSWRNARQDSLTPGDKWVCVQSVVADKRASLWVIDAGAPVQALADLPGKVQKVGENGPADGLLMDAKGQLYISSVEDHSIKVRQGRDVKVLLKDNDMVWPDTFTQGPEGTVYVTDSRIPDMSFFDPRQAPALETTLYKIVGKE